MTAQLRSEGDTDVVPPRFLYSIAETAELLSLSEVKVRRLADSGRLDTVKLDRRRLVPAEAIERFLATLSN